MQLLPTSVRKELGWTPYIWLIYLGFLFIEPIERHASVAYWAWLTLSIAVFLVLYLRAHWYGDRRSLLMVLGILLLGIVYMPFNSGAACFFIYAASLLPFNVSPRAFFGLLAAEIAIVLLELRLFHVDLLSALTAIVFSVLIGASSLHFAEKRRANRKLQLAQDEIEHLAKLAERERIARDLHDVLGHTLSLITLKSELAGRLLDKHPGEQTLSARREIADIEQAARVALAEVRQAIVGYRSEGLAAEIERAQQTLEAAGVKLHCESKPPALSPAEETVLSLALREAVTNIVRHAQARSCRLHMSEQDNCVSLTVEDDGRGGVLLEGNGLRGMRERVEAFGGRFLCESNPVPMHGTRITLGLPVKMHSEAVSS